MSSRKSHKLNPRSGYTLTEMLVVLAIISMLAAFLTPAVFGQLSRARARAASLQLETISSSLEALKTDVGRYPSSSEGLALLVANPAHVPGWLGPYTRDTKALADPWGRKLIYEPHGEEGYRLATLGQDGKVGGEFADSDQTISR